ncbi:MAG: type VI secretion system ATPase TssH [Alphaproteobacteria bacterium]|jgi:type VI secretion system protein VasG|nr:type VI secretion system ATPase TssH [Alphaproteobacteria bacterium]
MQVDTKALIGKLNATCTRALQSAAALCILKKNYNVELEHFLLRLFEANNTDIQLVLRHFELDIESIRKQLAATVDKFQSGNTAQTALSPHILTALEEAWMVSSLQLDVEEIRSGTILMAVLDLEALRGILLESCPLLLRLSRDTYRENMRELLANSPEAKEKPKAEGSSKRGVDSSTQQPAAASSALEQFTVDMTEQARLGKLDPIYGRDREIRQLIDVLSRRRQNNPILVGEAGVGKTAVVEGLAQRIASGGVPPSLKNISLRLLDVGLLQAGASVKGEFEERLKTLLDEVKNSPTPIVMFIDEAHTLIGAGGQAGLGDAANLLKPALARGELRTIAATTWAEYKRYIEKDAALTRRFEVVKVEEPSPEKALSMLRSIAGSLVKHHHVTILDEAIQAAVTLSQRFLTGRRLPDKAVSVLDTACAQVALAHSALPQPLEEARNQLILLQIEKEMLLREDHGGNEHERRLQEIEQETDQVTLKADALESQWGQSSEVVQKIQAVRDQLNNFALEDLEGEEARSLREEVNKLEKVLRGQELVGQSTGQSLSQSLVPHSVDRLTVAKVISGWTGIPLETMINFEEGLTVGQLRQALERRIIGQPHALDMIARQVVSYRAGLSDPTKPMGVFLLVGPSGVGKTETAQALAEILNGHERHLIRINMSEFQEAHAVATLKGAPPGYVGYGKGGTLTEAVRRNPYSVILLDEVEKAHPDVMEIFYQVFDKGMIEDSEGVEVDFRNTLIILTSNIGANDANANEKDILKALEKYFPHAFLARLTVIPYYPLSQDNLTKIVRLKLQGVAARLFQQHHARLIYTDKDIAEIAAQCTDPHQGARSIDHILTQQILPKLSEKILESRGQGLKELSLGD